MLEGPVNYVQGGLKDPFLGIKCSSNLSQKSGRLLEPYGRKLVFMDEYTPLDAHLSVVKDILKQNKSVQFNSFSWFV